MFSNDFHEVFIPTKGDNFINAIHFKLQKPKGIILFCHGNNGNLVKWGKRVQFFLDYNYEVLVFDYRNYGKSTGDFNEYGMYKDALCVYNHLKNQFKENNIIVYGFSLGGTFATHIASHNQPKILILEAPFFNLAKAIHNYSKFIPLFLVKYKFRTDIDIIKVKSPIIIFHGNRDVTTSYKDSIALINLNISKQNSCFIIDGGTHHNIKEFDIYKHKMKEILS
ncbi:alpha/beta hydrolase [Polaribacter sp. BM10]|uniref:alpha/beta hydrolase n=1 Tax=Polaribacter sp. BM10 TaxID=1529069 RepID=UPI0020C7E3C3|nr:alpha/beta fold hydrolase [Polaribacter sp. BM10]